MKRILNIAHRGGALLWPENTLFAFANAARAGFDGAELDVQLTRDGKLAVFHDFRLKPELCRNAQGAWLKPKRGHRLARIRDCDMAELQALEVGRARPGSLYARTHRRVTFADGEPICLILGDNIVEYHLADATRRFLEQGSGAKILLTPVDNPQAYGVAELDGDRVVRIVEKPREPISRRANIGLYYIRDWKLLYEGIEHVMRQAPVNGEYYLTDAFQYMIDHGARIRVIDVDGWYDAGKLDTLLDTNRAMLDRGRARRPAPAPGVRIFDPVYVEDGVVLEHSTIGPNVSIGAGTRITDSTVRDSVIGARSCVERSLLHDSMLGDEVVVQGARGAMTLGSHSEVRVDRD